MKFVTLKIVRKCIGGAVIVCFTLGIYVLFDHETQSSFQKTFSSRLSDSDEETNSNVCVDKSCANNKAGKIISTISRIYENSNLLENIISAYENSDQIYSLIESAKELISYRTKNGQWALNLFPTYKCLKYVKKALKAAGMTINEKDQPTYLTQSIGAEEIGPELESQGFINLLTTPYKKKMSSPYDAPVGSILVYSGGRYGHTEIRIPEGFISDYYNDTARTGGPEQGFSGHNRTLIGVYIKLTGVVK